MPKLAVIGLDGVNQQILEAAIDKGLMPNLEEIRKESTYTALETTYPPVTGPAWTSIMTGVNPARHGVFDFIDHTDNGRPYTSIDIQSETIYEAVSEIGDVALINLPLSYPPQFNGEFVGSFLAPDDDFVQPESLKDRFDFSDYKKSLTAFEKSFSVIQSAKKAAEDKKKLVGELLDDQEFFFVLFSAPDWIMHNHYREMETGEARPFQVFTTIDEAIGEIRKQSDNVILLSDHGFQAFDRIFHVNEWLKDEGYLKQKGSMESQWIDNPLLNLLMQPVLRFGPLRSLARKLYLSLETWLPLPENAKVRLGSVLSDGIDRENTEAFCPSSGIRGIYINDERFDGVADDDLVDELLDAVPDYMTARSKDEVFEGDRIDDSPDIVFEEQEYRVSRGMYGKITSRKQVNHHGRKGFFMAAGDNLERKEIDGASLYSVAPTIARLFGLDFDADRDPLPIVVEQIEIEPEKSLDI